MVQSGPIGDREYSEMIPGVFREYYTGSFLPEPPPVPGNEEDSLDVKYLTRDEGEE